MSPGQGQMPLTSSHFSIQDLAPGYPDHPIKTKEREREREVSVLYEIWFTCWQLLDFTIWKSPLQIKISQPIIFMWLGILSKGPQMTLGTCEYFFIWEKSLCQCDWVKDLEMGYYPELFGRAWNAITKVLMGEKRVISNGRGEGNVSRDWGDGATSQGMLAAMGS